MRELNVEQVTLLRAAAAQLRDARSSAGPDLSLPVNACAFGALVVCAFLAPRSDAIHVAFTARLLEELADRIETSLAGQR